ncbi:hypothetical protein OS493_002254 [Desmophyllum pertusum]|uniref:Uncharacterized protein n=1 Tax=Desmophyllum pertusum TaxID=174260 RepID=A0A9X0CTX5_9CNID|nr:hypothetical protein OS493_002254 [Desmophyllum pertusum]
MKQFILAYFVCIVASVAAAPTSVGPSRKAGNTIPTQWMIVATVVVVVLLIVALIFSLAVLFVWFRRRKTRRNGERSRTAEEASQYNYIFDDFKDNPSLPRAETTPSEVTGVQGNKRPPALPPRVIYQSLEPSTIEPVSHEERNIGMPPCPQYQSIDPSTRDHAGHERRNNEMPPHPQYQSIDPSTIEPAGHEGRNNGIPPRPQYQSIDPSTIEPACHEGRNNGIPPGPQYQSIDPSTREHAGHEERNREMYEELDFGTLNDGQEYENPNESKVDPEYFIIEPRYDTDLSNGNSTSNIYDNPGEAGEYLEPLNDTDLPNGNVASTVAGNSENSTIDPEYIELISDTNVSS